MEKHSDSDNIEPFLAEAVPTLESESFSGEFYLPPSHIQLLEQLEHLSRYSHFIQIVTGVAGIGKTTLLELFYPNGDDNSVHACSIKPEQPMSAQALLGEIARELNLDINPSTSVELQLQALLEHAELLKQLSRQLLIVIDDAQLLATEALDLLLNRLSSLEDDDLRPSMVLFASPTMLQQLQTPELTNVVKNSCHFSEIPPFTSEELNALLEHSYGAINNRLNDQQRQQVYSASLGLPGRLPRVLEATLKGELTDEPAATPTGSSVKSEKKPRRLWPWLALTATILLTTGLWFSWPNIHTQLLSPAIEDQTNRVRLQLPVEGSENAPKPALAADSELEKRLAQARATLEAEQPVAVSDTSATDTDHTLPGTNQQLELAPVKQAAPSQTTTNNKLALNLPLPSKGSTTPDNLTEASATTEVRYYGDGNSLLRWNPNGYTLQMLGARQESSVIKFIAAMPERDKLRYFATLYKDKPWYVVVYQQYPNRDAAMNAIGDLPPELRARRPWARSIHGVQDDIRRGAE